MIDGDDVTGYLSHEIAERDLQAEIYKRSFRRFIPSAFTHAEPSTLFSHNWHIDVIADHLQAVADGQIARLLINVPPGTMKSLMTCVLFPAWLWARAPHLRFIFSSYSEEFTKRDARKARNLVNSEWYRSHFATRLANGTRSPDGIRVPDSILEYGTTVGGLRSSAATSSGVTGKHVHGIVEDDPTKAQDAHSKAARDASWRYHKGTLSSRLLPGEASWRIVMMQRLHVDDVAGRILREESDYVHLCIPMHYEPSRVKMTPLGKPDVRTQPGELLWPLRMDEAYVKARTKDLGPHDARAQEEQDPTSLEGGIIQRDWLSRRWTKKTLPPVFDIEWISADLALTDTGDPIAVQHWGWHKGTFYLLKRFSDRMAFSKSYAVVNAMAAASPMGLMMAKVIENKANGHAMLELNKTLGENIPGFEPFNPKGDKIVRLNAVSPVFASGNVVIPDITEDPKIEDYVEQICSFPAVTHDDEVDATSQAFLWFQVRHGMLMLLNLDGGMNGKEISDPALVPLDLGM